MIYLHDFTPRFIGVFITRKKLENRTQEYGKNFEKTITPISQKKFQKGFAYLPHDFFV